MTGLDPFAGAVFGSIALGFITGMLVHLHRCRRHPWPTSTEDGMQ